MLRTRVITALALLAGVLVLMYFNYFPAVAVVVGLLFAAAVWECFRLFGSKFAVPGAVVWAVVFCVIAVTDWLMQAKMLFALCVAIWAIRLTPALAIGLPSREHFSNGLLNAVYSIAILGCFVAMLVLFKHSALYLFSVLGIVWIADIGAYFSGKKFGKRKLAPSISPGKSWEGAIGGWISVLVFFCLAVALPVFADTFPAMLHAKWGWLGYFAVMTLIVAASIVGDLFESLLKRRASMKDSSNLLPGHGGVLDRVDALIPVLPLAALFSYWF